MHAFIYPQEVWIPAIDNVSALALSVGTKKSWCIEAAGCVSHVAKNQQSSRVVGEAAP